MDISVGLGVGLGKERHNKILAAAAGSTDQVPAEGSTLVAIPADGILLVVDRPGRREEAHS